MCAGLELANTVQQRPCNTQRCVTITWQTGPFADCSNDGSRACNIVGLNESTTQGFLYRNVTCVDNTGARAADLFCESIRKPAQKMALITPVAVDPCSLPDLAGCS
jgi:hypothetical protein